MGPGRAARSSWTRLQCESFGATVMIRCWQVCILSVWQHYRDDSCRDAVLLNHQNRFVSRNTRVVQGEVSLWTLQSPAAAFTAASSSSKSVKYSVVTLEVTPRWQFLEVNSSFPATPSCSSSPLVRLLLERDSWFWLQKGVYCFRRFSL